MFDSFELTHSCPLYVGQLNSFEANRYINTQVLLWESAATPTTASKQKESLVLGIFLTSVTDIEDGCCSASSNQVGDETERQLSKQAL